MTPQENANALAEQFEALTEWEERYRFLLELGRALPLLPEHEKNEANRVHGCQSNVWMITRDEAGRIDFLADSDSSIVRGLIGILHHVYAGQRATDVLDFEIEALFTRLGFDQQLSLGRRNGLAGMVKRIRDFSGRNIHALPAVLPIPQVHID